MVVKIYIYIMPGNPAQLSMIWNQVKESRWMTNKKSLRNLKGL